MEYNEKCRTKHAREKGDGGMGGEVIEENCRTLEEAQIYIHYTYTEYIYIARLYTT